MTGSEQSPPEQRSSDREPTFIEVLVLTPRGRRVIAIGGMYTMSVAACLAVLFVAVRLPVAFGIYCGYTVLTLVITNRAFDLLKRKLMATVIVTGLPLLISLGALGLLRVV